MDRCRFYNMYVHICILDLNLDLPACFYTICKISFKAVPIKWYFKSIYHIIETIFRMDGLSIKSIANDYHRDYFAVLPVRELFGSQLVSSSRLKICFIYNFSEGRWYANCAAQGAHGRACAQGCRGLHWIDSEFWA